MTNSQSQVSVLDQTNPRLNLLRANSSSITANKKRTSPADPSLDEPESEGGSRAYSQTFKSQMINNNGGESFDFGGDKGAAAGIIAYADKQAEQKFEMFDTAMHLVQESSPLPWELVFEEPEYIDTGYSCAAPASYANQEYHMGLKVLTDSGGSFDLTDTHTLERLSEMTVVGTGADAYVDDGKSCMAPDAMPVEKVLEAKKVIENRLDVTDPEVASKLEGVTFNEEDKCWDDGKSCHAVQSQTGQLLSLAKQDLANGVIQYTADIAAKQEPAAANIPPAQGADLYAVSKLLGSQLGAQPAPAITEELDVATAAPEKPVVPLKPIPAPAPAVAL